MAISKSACRVTLALALGMCLGGVRPVSLQARMLLAAPATGPLQVFSGNPRYFTDGSGRAIYLTGSHTWNTIQDFSSLALPDGSFDGFLKWAKGFNHNFIRLWMVEHAWDADSGDRISPLPWARAGPGNALDGALKFDLTKFDQSYFDRVRQRAIQARDAGFYVSIMLFDNWSIGAGPWKGHPFHSSNNANGINGDPNGDGLGIEFHTLADGTITALQERYVRKMVDTVNDLDNVLYEVANETGISKDWQYHVISVIKSYEAPKAKQHPVGMTVGWPVGEVDNAALYASNAEWISPNSASSEDYYENPPPADGRKVIVTDTDHICPSCTDRNAWTWKCFTRGLNPIYMDDPASGGGREETRRAMGDTRRYADRMHLAAMTPRGDLTSTGYALANPGSEYLVYTPSGGSFSVHLTAGTYAYEWFNPASGTVAGSGTVTASGGDFGFTAPFEGHAALYLKVSSSTLLSVPSRGAPGGTPSRPPARRLSRAPGLLPPTR